jgi:hypothetical protein
MKVYDLFKGKPIFREFRDYLTCYKTMNRYGNYDYWNRIDAKQRTVYVAQKIVDLYLANGGDKSFIEKCKSEGNDVIQISHRIYP